MIDQSNYWLELQANKYRGSMIAACEKALRNWESVNNRLITYRKNWFYDKILMLLLFGLYFLNLHDLLTLLLSVAISLVIVVIWVLPSAVIYAHSSNLLGSLDYFKCLNTDFPESDSKIQEIKRRAIPLFNQKTVSAWHIIPSIIFYLITLVTACIIVKCEGSANVWKLSHTALFVILLISLFSFQSNGHVILSVFSKNQWVSGHKDLFSSSSYPEGVQKGKETLIE